MPFSSPFADLDIPKTNVLSYLFPKNKPAEDKKLWIDSQNPEESIGTLDLLQWVSRIGARLDRLGIHEGEVVLVHSTNHVLLPVIYLAIIANRRIFSGANPAYTASELRYQLKDTGARLLLAHPSLLATACDAATQVGLPSDRVLLFSEKENPPVNGVSDWHVVLGGDAAVESQRWKDMTEEEATQTVAAINYSSGTTGLPKGVCVSHYNLVANVAQIAYMKKIDKTWDAVSERWIGKQARPFTICLHCSDVILGFLPLYHAYGQLYTCIVAPTLGVPVYIMKQFDFEDMLRCVETSKITRLQIAPPVMVLLGKRPEIFHYDLSSLKDITCGAAPLSLELQLDVAQKLNVSIKQGWGMTEATCGGLNTENDEKITGSVGVLFPNIEGKLVDDDGREVTDGQPGEFWLRGPNVSLGYWKNEKATRETFTAEGWLKTGDVAILRGDSLYIVDRKKELIKVKGFQVAPAELEAVLLEHDAIADAAAVGMHLHDLEHPRAYIVLKPGDRHNIQEADIHDWLRSRVARHKYLTGGIAFVKEVPKSASGKILRKVLREWAKRDATIMSNSPRSSKL
ncbi:MAG: hypothetical protein LQ345_006085 [Seirophora villosa]|nr:MAG: hypothetical protein LQ345_006085 [Seirophora villosa]